jgi:hypothetical protein
MTHLTCPWWARWWHRRLRSADVEVMWPSLHQRASNLAEARVAWDVFLRQDGQSHWLCPCGQRIALLFRTLRVTVKE